MRTKEQILNDSLDCKPKTPDWDVTASIHERLTIEVLLDIRDIIKGSLETALTIKRVMDED